ncbi:MAG: SAM-dependent methyltransferase, partial [Solirubrobacteraceae bacterium]
MTGSLSRALTGLVLRRIGAGTLVVTQDGERRTWGSGPPIAFATANSSSAWRRLLSGSNGLADAYAEGLWDSPDLVGVIRLAARNAGVTDRWRRRLLPATRPLRLVRALLRPSTRGRRRQDIAAHYDLGCDLFGRMLDPTMTYSCAVFEAPQMTLEQAQRAKLELICDKLELRSTDRVLEIGSGWGAFALHAAGTRGCHVTTTTISRDQHAHVSRLVGEADLGDRVTVLCEDYRDLTGAYDKIVCIEMIEAVGWR